MAIEKISSETMEKIRRKSAANLPDSPRERSYTPQQIKSAFTRPIMDSRDSVIAEINRIVQETNYYISLVVSPTVAIEAITGGTKVTITDKDGVHEFNVMNGEKGDTGAQGIQGEKGDKGDNGTQGIQGIQGEKGEKGDKGDKGDTGAPGAKGSDGTDGKSAYQIAVDNGFKGTDTEWIESLNGAPGYTPVKGTDYYTEEDKEEIVQATISALPKYEGGVS